MAKALEVIAKQADKSELSVDRSDWAKTVKNIMRMDRLTKYLEIFRKFEKNLTKRAKERKSGESNQNRRKIEYFITYMAYVKNKKSEHH